MLLKIEVKYFYVEEYITESVTVIYYCFLQVQKPRYNILHRIITFFKILYYYVVNHHLNISHNVVGNYRT